MLPASGERRGVRSRWVKIPLPLTFTEKIALTDDTPLIQEPRVWQDELWTARVIKNEDDDGWAVAMFKTGQVEPALIGPWTVSRAPQEKRDDRSDRSLIWRPR